MSKTHELTRVTVRLSDEELEALDAQAHKRRMPRSALIKEAIASVVSPPTKKSIKPSVHLDSGRNTIDQAVLAVTRMFPDIARHRVEPIVCTVICAMAANKKKKA
jgi:hypothetical protein